MRYINLSGVGLQDIEIFLAVAAHKSFTKAAKSIFLTQSFVSKRILALEQATGLQLFVRNKRTVQLTPAGRLLAERWDGVTRTISDSLDEAHSIQTGLRGYLRIGFLEWGNLFFVPAIKQFRELCPDITLNFLQLSFKELRNRLINGELDVVFTTSYELSGFPENVKHLLLAEGPLMAIMSVDNPLSQRESISVSDLQTEYFLMVNQVDSPNYVSMVTGLCETCGFQPRISHYAADGRAHMINLMLNEGILLASRFFLQEKDLAYTRPVSVENTYAGINAAWLSENPNPAVSRLIRFLRDCTLFQLNQE